MPTSYTSLLGLALPVTGELSGTWGDTVNDYITKYLDASVAGTQTISGSQTAVTLSVTNGTTLTQVGSGATGSSQYNIINCTGNPASLLTITAPAASKTYVVVNATSTNQQVKIVGAGPTTGVTLDAGEKAVIAWNGSDFIKIATSAVDGVSTFSAGTTGFTPSSPTSGAVTLGGTLATTNGGTGLTSFTANRVFYASSTSAIGQSANLTFDGTTLTAANFTDSSLTSGRVTYATTGGNLTDSANLTFDGTNLTLGGGTPNGVLFLNGSKVVTSGSALTFDGTQLGVASVRAFGGSDQGTQLNLWSDVGGTGRIAAFEIAFNTGANNSRTEAMRLTSTGLGLGTSSPAYKLDVRGNIVAGNGTIQTGLSFSTRGEVGTFSNHNLGFFTNGVTQAFLDTAGNLGLGVPPSAWGSGIRSQQIGNYTALTNNQGGFTWLSNNAFFDTAWKYLTTNRALYYAQDTGDGGHKFFTAPSGLAGNPISFSQAMTLDASGNLVVGTTSNGVAKIYTFTTSVGVDNFRMADENSTIASGIRAVGDAIAFRTQATERARITSGGNLLVGTTVDNAGRVQVSGAGGIRVNEDGAGTKVINLRSDFAGLGPAIQVTTSDPLLFLTANTERARITSGGNLLVGTTVDSGARLSVNSARSNGTNVDGLILSDTLTGSVTPNFGVNLRYLSNNGAVTASIAFQNGGDGTNNQSQIAFRTQNTAGGETERARITSGGDLLVGTTSAGAGVGFSTKVAVDASGTFGMVIKSNNAGFECLDTWNTAASGTIFHIYFRDGAGATARGSITTNGAATSFNTSSDYRLKNITGPVTNSGAYIDSLKPVEGTWKADGSTFVGLIAHEAQEVSRTSVATGTKDGEQMQGMDYSNSEFIANIIAELQSLRARVAQLEAK